MNWLGESMLSATCSLNYPSPILSTHLFIHPNIHPSTYPSNNVPTYLPTHRNIKALKSSSGDLRCKEIRSVYIFVGICLRGERKIETLHKTLLLLDRYGSHIKTSRFRFVIKLLPRFFLK